MAGPLAHFLYLATGWREIDRSNRLEMPTDKLAALLDRPLEAVLT